MAAVKGDYKQALLKKDLKIIALLLELKIKYYFPILFKHQNNMKSLLSVSLLTLIIFCSCRKDKIEACAQFDQTAYLVADTIYLDANCSENVVNYLWTPKEGLRMLGNGKSSTERFVILPLSGTLSRTIELKVNNAKSTKTITKSALIL